MKRVSARRPARVSGISRTPARPPWSAYYYPLLLMERPLLPALAVATPLLHAPHAICAHTIAYLLRR